jgi:cell division protein FtsZ
MHEGPLADLFRNTESARSAADAAPGPPAEAAAAREAPVPSAAPATPAPAPAPEPDAPAAAARPRSRSKRRESFDALTPFMPRAATPATAEAPAAEPLTAAGSPALAPSRRADGLLSPSADSGAYLAIIRVVGVGGAGVNAVNRMIEANLKGVEFIAVNTDQQQLQSSEASLTVAIGREATKGLGSGSDPEIGRRAAEDHDNEIREALRGSDLVFVTAGEGGGTGTGAAPVVARIARELGALTVGIVTTPFRFEGSRRGAQATTGVKELARAVDTLVTIPNDRLLQVLDRRTSMMDAFRVADDILRQGVQGITDLITTPGLINLDFADVRTIMREAGSALMGIGMASGPNRASDAARMAVTSPLVGHEIRGAKGILLSVSGGPTLSLHDAMQIAEIVREAADDDCNIIFGATVDERMGDQVWVTVIATGFEGSSTNAAEANVRDAASPRAEVAADPPTEVEVLPGDAAGAWDDGIDVPDFLKL